MVRKKCGQPRQCPRRRVQRLKTYAIPTTPRSTCTCWHETFGLVFQSLHRPRSLTRQAGWQDVRLVGRRNRQMGRRRFQAWRRASGRNLHTVRSRALWPRRVEVTAVEWTAGEIATYWRSAYPGLPQRGVQWRGPCPLHQGSRDSFAVNGDSGQWTCHSECQRGGSLIDFEMLRSGTSFPDALKAVKSIVGRPSSCNGSRRIVATYPYRDEDGKLLFEVVRFAPKDFRQRRPDGSGGRTWNVQGVRRVLYRLPEVVKAERVFIVEGEKDSDLLHEWGMCGTTNPGGQEEVLLARRENQPASYERTIDENTTRNTGSANYRR